MFWMLMTNCCHSESLHFSTTNWKIHLYIIDPVTKPKSVCQWRVSLGPLCDPFHGQTADVLWSVCPGCEVCCSNLSENKKYISFKTDNNIGSYCSAGQGNLKLACVCIYSFFQGGSCYFNVSVITGFMHAVISFAACFALFVVCVFRLQCFLGDFNQLIVFL